MLTPRVSDPTSPSTRTTISDRGNGVANGEGCIVMPQHLDSVRPVWGGSF